MKLRCEMEVEVPDEVGEAVLAEQKDFGGGFRQYVKVDSWTYNLNAPLNWERVDEDEGVECK